MQLHHLSIAGSRTNFLSLPNGFVPNRFLLAVLLFGPWSGMSLALVTDIVKTFCLMSRLVNAFMSILIAFLNVGG
jgi:hypothetical protein